MSDAGGVRKTGNLDPNAPEFIPGNPIPIPIPFIAPASFIVPYPPPHIPLLPPFVLVPLPLPLPQYQPNNLQFMPFSPYPPLPPPSQLELPQLELPHLDPPQLEPPLPPTSAGPTRSVAFVWVSADVSETVVRHEMEKFGEVRTVQMERVAEGVVTVHFYDLRHARAAVTAIREWHNSYMDRRQFPPNYYGVVINGRELGLVHPPPPAPGMFSGRAMWAHYVFPSSNAMLDGYNQGTIVILNVDPTVSSASLHRIFQAYGDVKEMGEAPCNGRRRCIVEFYDVRDAARAQREMDGREIQGKPAIIRFPVYSHDSPPLLRDFSGHPRRNPQFSQGNGPAPEGTGGNNALKKED